MVMETRSAAIHRKMPASPRQLPITGFAHKAGVVSDGGVPARLVLAARDVATESRRAAALDRAHRLELAKAQMATIGITPSGPVIAEDVRDLQSWTGHGWRRLRRRVLARNE